MNRSVDAGRHSATTTTVVGVDGQPAGWQALAWASDEVNRAGGRLLICRVYPPGGAASALTTSPSLAALELADPTLARAVAACRQRLGGDRALVTVRVGDPVQHLVQVSQGASLLVIGASDAAGRSPLGTIAARLAARAAPTVVVIRPVPDAAGPYPSHVVVGIRGHETPARGARGTDAAAWHADVHDASDHAALDYAFGYASRHRLPLAAVHVGTGIAVHLDTAVEPWSHKYPEVPAVPAILPGRPAEALPEAAHGARLLVVGDRGRSSAARLLLGSVSQAALAHAACPVAVAHDWHLTGSAHGGPASIDAGGDR